MKPLLVAALALCFAGPAFALPPPGTDLNSPEHHWWECQKQNGSGITCCSVSDGHVLKDRDWRVKPDESGYQVRVDGKWFDVPADRVIQPSQQCGPEPNADTRSMAKVWFSRDWYPDDADQKEQLNIYCFMTGTMY